MAASELSAAVRQRDGISVIDLTGDVDSSAEHALEAAYEQAILDGARTVVLNFNATQYINSTGIALIVGLLARARGQAISVRAFGLSDHYREIFEITRLADFMAIADDEEHAVSGGSEESRDA